MCQISGFDDARLVNKDFEDGLTTLPERKFQAPHF